MTPKPYMRKAQYYETDQMAIIHHSNYIRWFEEARIDWLEQLGIPFESIEAAGIGVPVLAASCEYVSMVRFAETVSIHLTLVQYTGTRMTVAYQIMDAATGALRTTGQTRHCFLGQNGRPVSLKKAGPQFHEVMLGQLAAPENA